MPPRHRSKSHSVDISEKGGVRFLHLGSAWVQGAMRIARPWALELAYTREMMAGLLLRGDGHRPRSALLVGLGAGSLAKFLYRHLPDCRITAVEIDPQVEWVARQYFNLPDDPRRLKVVIDDAAEFMLAGEERYDLILCDGFDAEGRAGVLETLPFYQACRARLGDAGVLVANFLGRNRGAAESAARLEEAFDGRAILLPPCDSGNIIALGTVGEPVDMAMAELRVAALALRERTGLDLQTTLDRLAEASLPPGGRLVL